MASERSTVIAVMSYVTFFNGDESRNLSPQHMNSEYQPILLCQLGTGLPLFLRAVASAREADGNSFQLRQPSRWLMIILFSRIPRPTSFLHSPVPPARICFCHGPGSFGPIFPRVPPPDFCRRVLEVPSFFLP